MPDQKISALTGLTDIADNDLIPMVDITASETKYVQADTLYEYVQKNKNHVINGDFPLWQRATSQTSSGYGSDDRFVNTSVGSTKTHSQQSFTIGQTDVPNNPKYYSRTIVSSVAGSANAIAKQQVIEDVTKLSGKTVTLSFYAKADSAKNIATDALQYFGSGGSPSPNVVAIGVTTYALTTSWQKFTSTVTIPSVSGKTLGNDGNDSFKVTFWFDAGSVYDSRTNTLGQQSGTFDIAQVQLEEGSLATQFEQRTIAEELALCQRYYEKSYNLSVDPGTASTVGARSHRVGVASATLLGGFGADFAVPKRDTPTVTAYSPSTGTVDNVYDVTGASDAAVTGFVNTGESTTGFVQTTSAQTDGRLFFMHFTADAEL